MKKEKIENEVLLILQNSPNVTFKKIHSYLIENKNVYVSRKELQEVMGGLVRTGRIKRKITYSVSIK